jgi:NADH:ubiquinone oxidoreductase subunit 2 (subunit N)
MPRAASLAVEACLGVAALVAFVALLAGSARAGRAARRAACWGAAAALVAALATITSDAVWFFEALRVDASTQAMKAVVAAGLLLSMLRRERAGFAQSSAVGPFFALVCAAALALAASAGDLLVLWIALEIGSAALLIAVAAGGSWSTREALVRRLVSSWLPTSLVLLLGTVLLAAIAGATRFADLETLLPDLRREPVVVTGMVLIVGAIFARAVRFVAILAGSPV